MFNKVWKHFCYLLECLGMFILYALIRPLPFKWASAVGGKVARLIGPLLAVSNNARRNLKLTFPEITSDEAEEIIAGMWENLGRTMSEYTHLRCKDLWAENSPVEIVNAEIIDQLRDDGKPALLFLGHIANWEYATMGALQRGLKIAQLYRVLNNPYIAWFIGRVHSHITQELVTKGSQGAKQILSVLKRGDHVSMLIDQKLNEGIAVPFLGRDAMTAPALAKLALKFQCPVVPVRVERLKGIHCRVTYYPPLPLPTEGSSDEQVYQLMLAVNNTLSDWIRERPQDWMWVHNRWPRE
jgi:KDO2-lipid IV(A) lauroyltransferase